MSAIHRNSTYGPSVLDPSGAGLPVPSPLTEPSDALSSYISGELVDLQQQGLLRQPKEIESAAGKTAVIDGRTFRIFCSNNYLDLAADPQVLKAVREGLEHWGWGSAASRLISGSTTAHLALERHLAEFKKCPEAVLFPTGYMANLAVLTTLTGPQDAVLIDKLCHASIIDAAQASRATVRFYPHNDLDRLEALLGRFKRARHRFIVTEGLFSMDGDFGSLAEIAALKLRHKAVLMVDDAHGTGVLGDNGRGTAELLGVEREVDITVATLSKAIGSLGGAVCCSRPIADYLRNRSRSYIYTTSVPPVMCLAASTALQIIQDQPQRRRHLSETAQRLRSQLCQAGFNLGQAQAQIVPVILGQNDLALRAAELLYQRGFLIPAIRQPSVPPGKARLRISLMSSHTSQDVDDLIQALVDVGRQLGLANCPAN